MPSQAKKFNNVLVVGLGNPGIKYDSTRHNIGFEVLNRLCDSTWEQARRGASLVSNVSINQTNVHLMKPLTFMNKSGEAVQPMVDYIQMSPEAIIVIHDDADLPFGEVKVKRGGGTAGHNGLKSLVAHLGTNDFWRIRFGIGRSANPNIPLDVFVLSKWSEAERQQLDILIEQTIHKLHEHIVAPPQDES